MKQSSYIPNCQPARGRVEGFVPCAWRAFAVDVTILLMPGGKVP
jgi:hypothetical protein